MPYLARTFTPLRTAGRTFSSQSVAAFHSSSARQALSEDNIDHPERAKHIDHHKTDSVEKAKTGKGEWKPELASSSEQALSGDKHNMTIEQLQKLGQTRSEEDKDPSGSDSSKGAHKV